MKKTSPRQRTALISVFDKANLEELAKFLSENNFKIISTGGTAKFLKQKKIKVTELSDITGFPEILDGRVKTLHPYVFGAILADRTKAKHIKELKKLRIGAVDLVAVNLYPFEKVYSRKASWSECIENIDIGGVTLLRAGAKNHKSVAVLSDPSDYKPFMENFSKTKGNLSEEFRLSLAEKTFRLVAQYDFLIHKSFAEKTSAERFPPAMPLFLRQKQILRYGENPHQAGALYLSACEGGGVANARQVQGKELSFNNFFDLDAAWKLALEFENPACAIIKHGTPCGVALGEDAREAFVRAYAGDPVSAFGGVVAFNCAVDGKTADEIAKYFLECVIAPSISKDALGALKSKSALRLLEIKKGEKNFVGFDAKRITGGWLFEEWDGTPAGKEKGWRAVSARKPTKGEMRELKFAFAVVKHVRSNGIVVAKDSQTLGIGGGQTSRVEAVRIALSMAGDKAKGAVLASDAFFPFRDSIDLAAGAGISAIVQPGGSKRDEEVFSAANEHGMAMILTGVRHFKH